MHQGYTLEIIDSDSGISKTPQAAITEALDALISNVLPYYLFGTKDWKRVSKIHVCERDRTNQGEAGNGSVDMTKNGNLNSSGSKSGKNLTFLMRFATVQQTALSTTTTTTNLATFQTAHPRTHERQQSDSTDTQS